MSKCLMQNAKAVCYILLPFLSTEFYNLVKDFYNTFLEGTLHIGSIASSTTTRMIAI